MEELSGMHAQKTYHTIFACAPTLAKLGCQDLMIIFLFHIHNLSITTRLIVSQFLGIGKES